MSKLDMVLLGAEDLADPRIIELDRSTRLLHIEALTWAARYRTDGRITRASLQRLTDADNPALAAAVLVSAGLWTSTAEGWQLPWETQLSAEDANEKEARSKAKYRRQKAHQRGKHLECDPRYCKLAGADNTVDKPADSTVDTPPSYRLVPSRLDLP